MADRGCNSTHTTLYRENMNEHIIMHFLRLQLPIFVAMLAMFICSCGGGDNDDEETIVNKTEDTSSNGSDTDEKGSTDSEEESPYINFSPSSISVEACRDTFEIAVTSNVQYTVGISDIWLSQTSSSDAYVLCFIAAANESPAERTGTISLEYADLQYKINVTQPGAYITLSQSSVTLSVDGGTFDITVSSNVGYEVSVSDSWITQAASSSSSTLTFAASENTSMSARSATITLSWGNLSSVVTVTQEGGSIEVSRSSVEVSADGETFKLVVTSNVDFTTDIDVDWIALTYSSSSSSKETMVFSVEGNDGASARSAVISFSWLGVIMHSVTVTQEAGLGTEQGSIDDIVIEDW